MYILNIDEIPVSDAFKKRLSSKYHVVEKAERKGISNDKFLGVYCRFSQEINLEFIGSFDNLKFVACNATGIDHIDELACQEKGVNVYSLAKAVDFLGQNVTSSSEHTWCLLLAAARNLKAHQSSLMNKIYDRNQHFGQQLKGKTLGLVGLGRNGVQLARYASAFDMEMIYYDPYKFEKKFMRVSSLRELFTRSDIIVICCKLSSETRNMVDAKVLSAAKTGAILVNTARGEIVREDHLLDAVDRKLIAAYATDVICNERNALDSPIFRRSLHDDRIIITPHIGGATKDAWEITEVYLADLILNNEL